MKPLLATLCIILAPTTHGEDFVIEDTFIVSAPEGTIAKGRPDEQLPANIGYPKLQGPSWGFGTYWWDWVKEDTDLMDVPGLWQRSTRVDCEVSAIEPFSTDSGLSGARFHTRIFNATRPGVFDSKMVVLRDPKGKVVMFQMWGEFGVKDEIFKSLRYKDTGQSYTAMLQPPR
ncbi:MAG: hypothetical protein IAE97_02240 [Chthoniobacterales bacterium]|nr:hypothetical protein [Chthoniobacterales bacterium]